MPSKKGHLVVISGPSGVGKTTLVRRLLETPGLTRSVSATTRAPRAKEKDGVAYHFYTDARFRAGLDANEFLEHAEIDGHRYGTPLKPIEDSVAEGKIVVLAIDVQGARTLRKLGRPFLGIFLMPPSMEELRRRLLGRGDTPSEEAERRLRLAEREIAEKDTYDEVVTNDTVDGALGRILEILKGRHLI